MQSEIDIALLKAGSVKALESLMNKYSPYLFTIAKNMSSSVLSTQDLEEIVADVFVKLWIAKDKLDETQSPKWYLVTMVRNLTIDRMRACKVISLPLLEEFCGEDNCVESDLEKTEIIKQLIGYLNNLSEKDREIIVRYYYYNQRTCEIAKALGMQNGALRTRLVRLRSKLKTYFEGSNTYAKEI